MILNSLSLAASSTSSSHSVNLSKSSKKHDLSSIKSSSGTSHGSSSKKLKTQSGSSSSSSYSSAQSSTSAAAATSLLLSTNGLIQNDLLFKQHDKLPVKLDVSNASHHMTASSDSYLSTPGSSSAYYNGGGNYGMSSGNSFLNGYHQASTNSSNGSGLQGSNPATDIHQIHYYQQQAAAAAAAASHLLPVGTHASSYGNSNLNGHYQSNQGQQQQQHFQFHHQGQQAQSHQLSQAQQQYYYYPTPESSPDVQLQFLNDAVALNAATQHLLASSKRSSNGNTAMNASINGQQLSSSSSSSSSSSPSSSSSASAPSLVLPASHNFSYPQIPSVTSTSTQRLPVSSAATNSYSSYPSYSNFNQTANLVPNKSNQTFSSNGIHSLSAQNLHSNEFTYDAENGQIQLGSGLGDEAAAIASKLSTNWYISAAAAAAAANHNPSVHPNSSSSFNTYNTNEIQDTSLGSLNSRNSYNFHHKF